MTFQTKLQQVQNQWVLGTIKWIDLLKFIIKLDIWYYLTSGVIKFAIGLNIL